MLKQVEIDILLMGSSLETMKVCNKFQGTRYNTADKHVSIVTTERVRNR